VVITPAHEWPAIARTRGRTTITRVCARTGIAAVYERLAIAPAHDGLAISPLEVVSLEIAPVVAVVISVAVVVTVAVPENEDRGWIVEIARTVIVVVVAIAVFVGRVRVIPVRVVIARGGAAGKSQAGHQQERSEQGFARKDLDRAWHLALPHISKLDERAHAAAMTSHSSAAQ
jgi:hypothetical protein